MIKNFQGKKKPKESASYKYLSLIMLDPVIKTGKKYYPQTQIIKNKMENLVNDNLDLSSSDQLDNESDNESHNESGSESDKVDE